MPGIQAQLPAYAKNPANGRPWCSCSSNVYWKAKLDNAHPMAITASTQMTGCVRRSSSTPATPP